MPTHPRRGETTAFIAVVIVGALVTACVPETVLRVPESFTISSLQEDLVASIDSAGISSGGYSIAPGEAFALCDGGGGACREILFSAEGAEAVITEAVALLGEDAAIGRVVIAVDLRRSMLCDEQARFPVSDGVAVECVAQRADESATEYIERIDAVLRSDVDALVAILGAATPALIRRVVADAPPIVAELLFPASGERLRDAGVPVAGAISHDIASIFASEALVIDGEGPVYVPIRLFRY